MRFIRYDLKYFKWLLMPSIHQILFNYLSTYVYSNGDQERIYPICRFQNPVGSDLCSSVWPYSSLSENAFFHSNLLIYIFSTWESYFSYGPGPTSGITRGPCLLCTQLCTLLCFLVLDYEIDYALLCLPFHTKNIALKT